MNESKVGVGWLYDNAVSSLYKVDTHLPGPSLMSHPTFAQLKQYSSTIPGKANMWDVDIDQLYDSTPHVPPTDISLPASFLAPYVVTCLIDAIHTAVLKLSLIHI